MRKRSIVLIVALVLAALLCACGEKTYHCAWCGEKVTQVPKEVNILGQDAEVCDDCYPYFK